MLDVQIPDELNLGLKDQTLKESVCVFLKHTTSVSSINSYFTLIEHTIYRLTLNQHCGLLCKVNVCSEHKD